MVTDLSVLILLLAAAYLAGLGVAVLVRPKAARAFLTSFAQTSRANAIEAALRALVGVAFVSAADRTQHPTFSIVFGVFLIASAALMLVFAKLHQRFAARSTASLARAFPLFGAASIVLAVALIWFVIDPGGIA